MVLLESLQLEMGEPAANFSLKGIDEQTHTLKNFSEAKVLVIVFMCNHCPYVQAVWGRLVALQERFKDEGVQFVGINANINPDYAEDSFENMQKYSKKYKMNFPYLADETQEVAKKYKAQCTPDIYVFDKDRKLAYHGRIDDNWQEPSEVQKEDLADAITAILNGKLPSEDQIPSMGCSIKWKN
ncbi:MAG: thioredoxin family protein [bacterium]|nr:thioredoxin family protein [bacterium]